MNPILLELQHRLINNDPTLMQLSLCRLPLTQISANEVATILSALEGNTHVTSLELWLPDPSPKPESSDMNQHEMELDSWDFSSLVRILSNSTSLETVIVSYASGCDAWRHLLLGFQGSTSIHTVILGEATVNRTDKLFWDDDICGQLRQHLRSTKTLRNLTLRGLQLTVNGMNEIALGLTEGHGLHSLEVHQIETKEGDPLAMGRLLLAVRQSSVESLSVSECDLSLEYVDEDENHPLTALLARNTKLQTLRLMDCLDVDGVRPLAFGMFENTTLKTLDLRNCDLSPVSWEAMGELLSRPFIALESLLLDEAGLDDGSLSLLSTGLRKNKSIQSLSLRNNGLTHLCCHFLDLSLRFHPTLKALDISENSIGDCGAMHIGQLLQHNRHLKKVILEGCDLSHLGVQSLCDGLSFNQSMKSLHIGQNSIGDVGAMALSGLLLGKCGLITLDLTSCGLRDEGIKQISSALIHNSTLQRLCLAFNGFGNNGARFLGEALPFSHLRSLELQFNNIDELGMSYLIIGLSCNYFLQDLFVLSHGSCGISKTLTNLLESLSHYLSLNRAGRRAITEDVRPSLWPQVLVKAKSKYGTNAVYHILRQMPRSLAP